MPAAVTPRLATLLSVSALLRQHGRRGLRTAWVATLPAADRQAIRSAEGRARFQRIAAERAAAAQRQKNPEAMPLASWFPRKRCA